jgi:hypothetical protein
MIPFLSQSQCLSYGGSNGKISWLGCEPMYIATKLTVFVGMLLQEVYLLSLPFFLQQTIWEEKGGTDRQMDFGDRV